MHKKGNHDRKAAGILLAFMSLVSILITEIDDVSFNDCFAALIEKLPQQLSNSRMHEQRQSYLDTYALIVLLSERLYGCL